MYADRLETLAPKCWTVATIVRPCKPYSTRAGSLVYGFRGMCYDAKLVVRYRGVA